jgi:uncharacterized membrane protein YheB (UPF0754 family)
MDKDIVVTMIIKKFEEWDLSVKWLKKFVFKFRKYVKNTIIPDIQNCDDKKNIVVLTERFIYMFNSLLAEYEFLTEGKTDQFKMHALENNTAWSHSRLESELNAIRYKKFSISIENKLETILLNTLGWNARDILHILENSFQTFDSSIQAVSITQNILFLNTCDRTYLISYKMTDDLAATKIDNSRLSLKSRESYRAWFQVKLQTEDGTYINFIIFPHV